ncbi:MAG: FHA domain-containing protein, partial [Pirellulaceae bacterium]|nr:FHA domain-containing protein [Pirellulaceae bacterium]
MKIWFNKVNESRRTMVELDDTEICLGRDLGNHIVLKSPLVSRRHAVVRRLDDDQLELENVGVNSCLVGDSEVLGGDRVTFASSVKVRIWPYTISFDADVTTA